MKIFKRFCASYAQVVAMIKRLKEAGYGDVTWERTRSGFEVQGYLR